MTTPPSRSSAAMTSEGWAVSAGSRLSSGIGYRVLVLARRQADDQAVEGVADLQLAREPAVGLDRFGELEHRLLHRRALAGPRQPGFVDVDVAGGAGGGAAAVGVDAGDAVLHRPFHDRKPAGDVYDVRRAAVLDVGDLGHWACVLETLQPLRDDDLHLGVAVDEAVGHAPRLL